MTDFFQLFYEGHQKAFPVADAMEKTAEEGQMYIAIDPYEENDESELADWCVANFEFLKLKLNLSTAYSQVYGIDLYLCNWKGDKNAQREYCRILVEHMRKNGVTNIAYTHHIETD